jgi:hypothetical protein
MVIVQSVAADPLAVPVMGMRLAFRRRNDSTEG